MTNKLTVLFKMMVLYMLEKVNSDLTAIQIGEFMVVEDYLSFYAFQQILFELERDGLVRATKSNHNTFYSIQDSGRQALDYFAGELRSDIRDEIDAYVTEKKWEIRKTGSYRTDYTLNSNGEYAVRMQAYENREPLIDLTITVPDEEIARKVCDEWKEKNDKIYAYIMQNLL